MEGRVKLRKLSDMPRNRSDMKTDDKGYCRQKLRIRCPQRFEEFRSTWPKYGLAGLLVTSLLISGCTSAPLPVAPSTPQYLDYLFPNVPEYLSGQPGVQHHNEAWQALQAGYLTEASTGFSRALNGKREFFPALVGLGYVALAERQPTEALERFREVLVENSNYVPAWIGQAEALLQSSMELEALQAYQKALAFDPGLDTVKRRVEVLRFRRLQILITTAQKADTDGQPVAAAQAYREALEISPESAYLYRGLAAMEREIGNTGSALENITRANSLESDNPSDFIFQGEILESMGDLDGAEQAYSEASRLKPSDINAARLATLQARLTLSRLPPSYRTISDSVSVTRGEIAALVGVRLTSILSIFPRDETILITDTRGHWADPWVRTVSQTGVMEVFPNHTFEPNRTLRRGELARVVDRLLSVIESRFPENVFNWKNQNIDFSDLLPRNIQYESAAIAVASGVMSRLQDGTFRPTGLVSGQEAIKVVDRILDIYDKTT